MKLEAEKRRDAVFKGHIGTCDSCGDVTYVSHFGQRGIEFACGDCIFTIAEARRQIYKERKAKQKSKREEVKHGHKA